MLNITFFQVTKKRIKEELSLAQTLTAGVLEQAALMRNDESILVHIRGQNAWQSRQDTTDVAIKRTQGVFH